VRQPKRILKWATGCRWWTVAIGVLALLYCYPTGQVQAYQFDDPFFQETVTLSARDIDPSDGILYITDSWKFRAGDDSSYAHPNLFDADWEPVSTLLGPADLAFINWNGIGWFRLRVRVDSSLVNRPLGLFMTVHNGASEVFLDGKPIGHWGVVNTSTTEFKARTDHRPRSMVFSSPGEHVLAVRYANPEAASFNDLGFTAGFRLLLGTLDQQVSTLTHRIRWSSTKEMFYVGGLLAFTIIHLMLFMFYPAEKSNLYFSIFTASLALLSFSEFETFFTTDPQWLMTYSRLAIMTWVLTVIFALRFVYSIFHPKGTPKQFWALLVLGLGVAIVTWIKPELTEFYRELFVLIAILEMIRMLVIAFYRKLDGAWIIGAGLGCFVLGISYAVASNLDVVQGESIEGSFYGSIFLILAMSVYLSRGVAWTNKRLQTKLKEVREWSDRALKQERINQEKELERKLLAAENERKTQQLEEARTLQLSMLPKKIPQPKEWDIAVYMDTATEVGGDYYDFSKAKDGTLTIAVGDATGHGMKAGIMVATAKSYFHTLADDFDNLDMLRRMSAGIRNMELKMMYMGMMFLKLQKHRARLVAAGMPPALIYRKEAHRVEPVVLKGLPLGAQVEFPYKEEQIALNRGDILLLYTDGLQERFNQHREQFGLDRIQESLKNTAEQSAADIITQLTQRAEQWCGGADQEDDITIVALKAQ
jgi:serine phosphatase RsbU (regulator of sigma subunit)